MKIIINNQSGLPDLEAIQEVSRIMKRGFVAGGNMYQRRLIYKECRIVCTKNEKSFSFLIERI